MSPREGPRSCGVVRVSPLPKNISFSIIDSDSTSSRVATITFVEGKTLKSTGPYTLHVTVPLNIATELENLITTRLLKHARYLFCAADMSLVSKELKAAGLEMRS